MQWKDVVHRAPNGLHGKRLSLYTVLSVDAIIDDAIPHWNPTDYQAYRAMHGDRRLMDEFHRLIEWPRQHIIYETTGGDHAMNRTLRIAREAQAAGYRVDLQFHAVTPERVAKCVRRRNRIQKRQVSPEDMKRVFFEAYINFARIQARMRRSHLFDSLTVATL